MRLAESRSIPSSVSASNDFDPLCGPKGQRMGGPDAWVEPSSFDTESDPASHPNERSARTVIAMAQTIRMKSQLYDLSCRAVVMASRDCAALGYRFPCRVALCPANSAEAAGVGVPMTLR